MEQQEKNEWAQQEQEIQEGLKRQKVFGMLIGAFRF